MRWGIAIAFVLASIVPASLVHAALIAASHEITVNTHTDGWQHDPSVAVAPGDGFVVVWEDNRFDNDLPDVAALVGGGFVVVWRQGLDGGWILARKLAADGAPVGDPFRIDTARAGSATPY